MFSVVIERGKDSRNSRDGRPKSSTYKIKIIIEVELKERSRRIYQPITCKCKMKLLHEVMVEILKPLYECESTNDEKLRRGEKKMWLSVLTSYFSDILQGKICHT